MSLNRSMAHVVALQVLLLALPSAAGAQETPSEDPDAASEASSGEDEEARPEELRGPKVEEVEEDTQPVEELMQRSGPRPRLDVPITFDGYFWVDTGYMDRNNAREGDYDQGVAYMQGRFVLGAEYLREFGSLYALARAELIGFVNEFTKSQFEAHVLDAYVMFGQDTWDIQVGRFLAWEVYDRGSGIELYTPEEAGAFAGPPLYWLDIARGHMNESGQAAVHFYPFENLGIELAGVYGQEQNQNRFGFRPVVDFNVGGLQLIAGYEYLKQEPQTIANKVEVTSSGYAAKAAWSNRFMRVGANFAQNSVDRTDINGDPDGEQTRDNTTVGGFFDVTFLPRNTIGAGYHFTSVENLQGEINMHHRAFVSYVYDLPIDGLSIKGVYGYALADIEDVDVDDQWENNMHSVRVRLAYIFQ